MKVLKLTKTILKFLGIIESKQDPNHIPMIISQYICLTTPILFLIPSIGFFVINFTDVAQATNAFYLICIIGMGFLTYLDCLVNRATVCSIIQRFQHLVDTCDPGFQPFYVQCDNQINKIVHHFEILLFILVFTANSIPLAQLVYDWLNGDYSKDSLVLSASLLYISGLSTEERIREFRIIVIVFQIADRCRRMARIYYRIYFMLFGCIFYFFNRMFIYIFHFDSVVHENSI